MYSGVGYWLAGHPSVRTLTTQPKLQRFQPFVAYRQYKEKEFLLREYVEKQESVRTIAKDLGCSHSTILAALKRFNIPMRNLRPEGQKRGQVAYGRRTLKSKEVEHKRELEVLAKIQNLRSQGFSYWKIADVLNAMGVPTKTRKAKWQAATVMKILKRNSQSGIENSP